MQKEITQRFIKCLHYLKDEKVIPSIRQFALSIDIHPQCISDIVTQKRVVNCDILNRSIQLYNVNPIYIFKGSGSMISDANESVHHDNGVVTVVTDNMGNERIVHVPFEAHAGYGNQMTDPVFMQELPSFTLPDSKYAHGTYRCFDVIGDSMEPTLFSGDKVVCSYIEQENWLKGIKNNYVYVVITQNDVYVKRVNNKLKESSQLLISSDNQFYEVQSIDIQDLVEVWQVSVKISQFMPSPNHVRNGLHHEVEGLKDTISEQSKLIQSLNKTVEKLLKQNRTSSFSRN